MRLQILSDLHLDHVDMQYQPADCDAVVLAGDICGPRMNGRLKRFIDEIDGRPVFYIPGNHEYYDTEYFARNDELRSILAKYPNVRLLIDETADFKGYRIHGTTLWTDFNLYGKQATSMAVAKRCIADFRSIKYRYDYGIMTPEIMLDLHQNALRKLDAALGDRSDIGRQTIVLSHFVPFPKSIHPQYTGDSCNPYFCSDQQHLTGYPVLLWVHGHTHSSFNYRLNGTDVVCNPRGYGAENAKDFDPKLVVEV